jgi:hypothetical protein
VRGRTWVLVAVVLLVGSLLGYATRPGPQRLRGASDAAASLPAPTAAASTPAAPRPAPPAPASASPAARVVAAPAKPAPLIALSGTKRTGVLTPQLEAIADEAKAALGSFAVAGPTSIVRPTPDSVVVEIRMKGTDPASVGRLSEAGAKVLDVSDSLHSVTASVRTMHLDSLAKAAGVLNIREALAPLTSAAGATASASPTATPSCTPIVSEGDVQLKAALARSHYSVDGSGITVGILSDSFDRDAHAPTHAADDVMTGALPGATNPCGFSTPVDVVDDSAPTSISTDEGRAMAQIVHSLAPGAKIAFATGCCTQPKMAHNIEALAAAGATVIVDDLAYPTEPMYQDGPIADAITQVRALGVTYVSAAGNSNIRIGGRDVGSYETPVYRGMVCPLPAPYVDCHDFGGSNFKYGLTLAPHGVAAYEMQWAQPWFGVTTDLDLIAVDDTNHIVSASTIPNTGTNGTQEPVELVVLDNPNGVPMHVNLIVGRVTGPDIRFKLFALGTPPGMITSVDHATGSNGDVVGPTVFGHNGSANAITVGAIRYAGAAEPEEYSSRGPVTTYLGPVNGTTPAGRLTKAISVDKPDVVASDCVRTTFFHDFDGVNYRFCGTSAAAPHAAAVAALEAQKLPGTGPRDITAGMDSSAVDLLPIGRDDTSGFGLVDADEALALLRILPSPSPTTAPTVTSAPSTKPALSLSSEEPKAGSVLKVKGSHFAAHTLYDIYLHSKPIFLGSTPTTSSGDFSIDLFLPAGVTPGIHTIEVRRADGNVLEATAPLTIDAAPQRLAAATTSSPSRLPRTGGDIMRTFMLALMILFVGAGFVVWSRRETLRLAVASIRTQRSAAPSVYAVIARGASALPEITELPRRQERKRS